MVKHFDRRIKNLNLQIDHETLTIRFNSFIELTSTFVSEVLEQSGLKFLKDLINQLYS